MINRHNSFHYLLGKPFTKVDSILSLNNTLSDLLYDSDDESYNNNLNNQDSKKENNVNIILNFI